MKEIIAIIRPKKVGRTKDALDRLGFSSITAVPVLGRGKQKGLAGEIGIDIRPEILEQGKSRSMKYIPKRQLSLVVNDEDVDTVVATIIAVNQTGDIGDGKVFIRPVERVVRIRTDEVGEQALR